MKKDFQDLMEDMCTTSILTLPNFTKTFVLKCDYLGKILEVILIQECKLLDFTSKQLCVRGGWENQLMKKEMMAILQVVEICHPYLLGKRFQAKSKHRNLKYFLEQRTSSREQQK